MKEYRVDLSMPRGRSMTRYFAALSDAERWLELTEGRNYGVFGEIREVERDGDEE